jgi:hypothetical protein
MQFQQQTISSQAGLGGLEIAGDSSLKTTHNQRTDRLILVMQQLAS